MPLINSARLTLEARRNIPRLVPRAAYFGEGAPAIPTVVLRRFDQPLEILPPPDGRGVPYELRILARPAIGELREFDPADMLYMVDLPPPKFLPPSTGDGRARSRRPTTPRPACIEVPSALHAVGSLSRRAGPIQALTGSTKPIRVGPLP